jgi:hypothetical protein
MTQSKEEAALAELEGPHQEAANAEADLATIESLIATTPHAGAKKALEADLPHAKKRLSDATAALAKHTKGEGAVTQADIDAAAQKVIDARGPQEEEA